MFPDDDDMFSMVDMPLLPVENSSPPLPPPPPRVIKAEPVRSIGPISAPAATSACVFRQPVQPIVRAFTYLSTHIRQRARAMEAGRVSIDLPESICIKVFH